MEYAELEKVVDEDIRQKRNLVLPFKLLYYILGNPKRYANYVSDAYTELDKLKIDTDVNEFAYHMNYPKDAGDEVAESLYKVFYRNYSWHYAHILQDTFQRGSVCLAYPKNHWVWMDVNGVCVDALGTFHMSTNPVLMFIPEHYLGNFTDVCKMVKSFDEPNYSTEYLLRLGKTFTHDMGYEYNEEDIIKAINTPLEVE